MLARRGCCLQKESKEHSKRTGLALGIQASRDNLRRQKQKSPMPNKKCSIFNEKKHAFGAEVLAALVLKPHCLSVFSGVAGGQISIFELPNKLPATKMSADGF